MKDSKVPINYGVTSDPHAETDIKIKSAKVKEIISCLKVLDTRYGEHIDKAGNWASITLENIRESANELRNHTEAKGLKGISKRYNYYALCRKAYPNVMRIG